MSTARNGFLDGTPRLLYYSNVKRFQDLDSFTNSDIQAAIQRNDPNELQFVPITVALALSDAAAAQLVCIDLCCHPDDRVRGNAIMSLGHIARRFRTLDERTVKPLIEAALSDNNEYVRVNAKYAADEIHQFLHWDIAGHVYG